jgi:hypothetical protein
MRGVQEREEREREGKEESEELLCECIKKDRRKGERGESE